MAYPCQQNLKTTVVMTTTNTGILSETGCVMWSLKSTVPKKETRTKVYKELTRVISRGDDNSSFFGANGELDSTDSLQLRSGDTWYKKTPVIHMAKHTGDYSLSGHGFKYWKL